MRYDKYEVVRVGVRGHSLVHPINVAMNPAKGFLPCEIVSVAAVLDSPESCTTATPLAKPTRLAHFVLDNFLPSMSTLKSAVVRICDAKRSDELRRTAGVCDTHLHLIADLKCRYIKILSSEEAKLKIESTRDAY